MPEFFRDFFRKKEQLLEEKGEEKPQQPVTVERIGSPERKQRQELDKTSEEQILENYEKKETKPLNSGANTTVFVELKDDGSGVFKPKNGEKADLRDHIKAGTYFNRERAAYLVDRFLGFNLVPPTVIREIDGEIGSLQQFVPDSKTIYEIPKDELVKGTLQQELKKLWIFDYIIYNSDRHSGNFLIKPAEERIYAIDNGLSFGDQYTIFYKEFWGNPIPSEVAEGIEKFLSWKEGRKIFEDLLRELLRPDEVEACMRRIENISRIIKEHGNIPGSAREELTF